MDRMNVVADEEQQFLVVEHGPITVMCNLSDHDGRSTIATARELVLASDPGVTLDLDGIALPADSVAVLRRR
jgi:hypothetical protein